MDFWVGYTAAMDFDIENITGLKVPDKWLDLAKKQNKLAKGMIKQVQKPVFLGQCAGDAASFNWEDHNGVTGVLSGY